MAVAGAVASLLVIAGVLAVLVLPAVRALNAPPPQKISSNGKEVAATVQKGWTAAEIGQELADKKVIESSILFRMYIKYYGLGDKLRPGDYTMRIGMTYGEAAATLMKGPPDHFLTITIPEGYTIDQEADTVAKALGATPDEFKSLAKNGTSRFIADYPFLSGNKTATLEGYLFPDTYQFKPNATAEDVIRKQLTRFKQITDSLNVTGSGKNIHDVVTAASLIEREARVGEERPLISAVIGNRLKKGMLLQIDATVQYALPEWKKELTYKDLEVDSPYNTYKHPGLPPGPIGAPGEDCLKAAVNPANVDYLYYVVKDDAGHHFFTSDYNEFNKAKARQPKP
ncbi:MAG: endolytic transglycosylase MltG [Chloroflexi bacterium]|nr:endolytic transglycosylase MltG [Chloroflexota bacterium]